MASKRAGGDGFADRNKMVKVSGPANGSACLPGRDHAALEIEFGHGQEDAQG